MEQLQHFSHDDHLLSLVHLQSNHKNESSDEEEEEEHEDGDDFVAEDHHVGQCNMCKEEIYSFHLCYYHCKECNYSLHKFCAEMPTTIQNHPLHPNHNLTLAEEFQDFDRIHYAPDYEWTCGVCNLKRKLLFNYHCWICSFSMDIICATMSQQKMDHPSHPHQLQRNSKQMISRCNACSHEHEGTFYNCITCSFSIHLGCALLPSKLLIQQSTNGTFTHSHPLTLAYSFPRIDIEANFYPKCRVCGKGFYIYFWLYKCDKCRYYVHSECGASKIEPYMSIFLPPGYDTIRKNYKDEDHPDLLHCPFPDESYNLLKHHFHNKKDVIVKETNGNKLLRMSSSCQQTQKKCYKKVTRSIGDDDLKPSGVTAEPEVTETILCDEDEYMVMASDGLWDVVSNDEVVNIIKNTVKDPGMCSKRLAMEAGERGSNDNITVIVVFLRPVSTAERIH